MQGAADATMKAIRQVKTVFIIFIAFVCCWSPYIVVLLYDSSDSLPLPVHLYASMLAHLHASLNFAIYGLMNRNLRYGIAAHVSACCRRVASCNDVSASPTATAMYCSRRAGNSGVVHGNRSTVSAEYHQLRGIRDYSSRNVRRCRRPPIARPTSVRIIKEREFHSTIVPSKQTGLGIPD